MHGPAFPGMTPNLPARARRLRAATRALGLGLAALALAAGSAAAATQLPNDPGGIDDATGPEVALVYSVFHNSQHVAVTSVPINSPVHVSLSVDGINGTPTGQVRIYTYGTADCSGNAAYVFVENLSNGEVDAADDTISAAIGMTKSAYVLYMGDATYAPSSGQCRSITFTKLDPVVNLSIHDADHQDADAVPFTEQVHAYVEVRGKASRPNNWVLVRAWTNGTCSGTDYVYTTKNLDEDANADSVLPLGFDGPGVRSYKARYSGDKSYNPAWSACVAVTGTKVAPKMAFALHDASHDPAPSSVLINTPIHPAIGLAGTVGQPTGQVTIYLYNGESCNTQIWQVSVPAASSIDAEVAKQARGFPSVGSWRATYEGDGSYKSVTSACLSERWRALPGITLAVHDGDHDAVTSVVVGTTLHLRVAVSGAFGTATGSVALKVSPNSNCTSATSMGSGSLAGGVLHDASLDYKPASTGTYWFQASYKGDGTYAAKTSACVPVDVTPVPSTPTPAPTPTAKPNATATPAPSAKPTSSPTPTPGATGGPATDPSAAPTAGSSAPAASSDPAVPASETDAVSTAQPSTAAASDGPLPTAVAGGAGPASPDQGDGSGADGGMAPLELLLALPLLAGLLVAIWFGTRSRRRRAESTPAAESLTVARSS